MSREVKQSNISMLRLRHKLGQSPLHISASTIPRCERCSTESKLERIKQKEFHCVVII